MRGAVRLGAAQDARMESVRHGPVTEEKYQGFGFVPLRGLNAKFLGFLQHKFLDFRIDAVVSIQHPRDRGNADVCRGRDFSKSNLGF